MARSLWTGAVSFGLINVPVALFSAVRDVDVHFHQLHEPDGARIETRRFCSEEDAEVQFEEIGRGYELEDGGQVVLTDEDLAAAAPRRTRTIDIQAFVDLADVDPLLYDHPYFLAPVGEAEGGLRAYRLLVEVMRTTERAALGRFVLRSKEYLVLLRVRDGRLSLTTMRFHDEVRSTDGIGAGGRKPPKAQVEAATRLVEALAADWDPSRYRDCHRERLLDVIERKKRGRRIAVPRADRDEGEAPPDLMAALKESLDRIRGAGDGGDGGDGGGRASGDGGDGGGRGRGGRRRAADDLSALTRDELYARAQDAGVPGRSSMSKRELIDALSG